MVQFSSEASRDMTSDISARNMKLQSNSEKSGGACEIFSSFSNDTTIHGLKYIGENRRHWVERLFWLIFFTASVITCTIIIMKTYIKWQSSPVIVSFNEKLKPIWEIPFPAVTICPETRTNVNIFNFSTSEARLRGINYDLDLLTVIEAESFEALSQVCSAHVKTFFRGRFRTSSKLEGSSVVSALKGIAAPWDLFRMPCNWRNKEELFYNIFTMTITDMGVCYTFNALKFRDIFKDDV